MPLAAPLLLVVLASTPAAAPPAPDGAEDPLARLVATLGKLPATTPIRAQVEHRVRYTQGEEDGAPFGSVSATASSGPQGLQVAWSPAVLARADAEERARRLDPDAATPTRDAIADLRPLALARALDAASDLVRDLASARLVEERVEPLDGVPTRQLRVQWKPVVPARDRRYVKDAEASSLLWIGPDGVPVAEERRVLLKGRIFLFIGFEIEQRESLRFGHRGDRLVVLRQESDQRSEGASERRDRQAVTSLLLAD